MPNPSCWAPRSQYSQPFAGENYGRCQELAFDDIDLQNTARSGEAYTQVKPALELVLANPKVKSLVINFCGAFARTDVMTEGVLNAWEELKPTLPVFFSVHGTGDVEAVAMLKERLGIIPFKTMDEASKAAVEAAQKGSAGAKPWSSVIRLESRANVCCVPTGGWSTALAAATSPSTASLRSAIRGVCTASSSTP